MTVSRGIPAEKGNAFRGWSSQNLKLSAWSSKEDIAAPWVLILTEKQARFLGSITLDSEGPKVKLTVATPTAADRSASGRPSQAEPKELCTKGLEPKVNFSGPEIALLFQSCPLGLGDFLGHSDVGSYAVHLASFEGLLASFRHALLMPYQKPERKKQHLPRHCRSAPNPKGPKPHSTSFSTLLGCGFCEPT